LLKFKDNHNFNKYAYNEIKELQDNYIGKISAKKNSDLELNEELYDKEAYSEEETFWFTIRILIAIKMKLVF
jgi:hypothetical protein